MAPGIVTIIILMIRKEYNLFPRVHLYSTFLIVLSRHSSRYNNTFNYHFGMWFLSVHPAYAPDTADSLHFGCRGGSGGNGLWKRVLLAHSHSTAQKRRPKRSSASRSRAGSRSWRRSRKTQGKRHGVSEALQSSNLGIIWSRSADRWWSLVVVI